MNTAIYFKNFSDVNTEHLNCYIKQLILNQVDRIRHTATLVITVSESKHVC
jgi:hypothetical protein